MLKNKIISLPVKNISFSDDVYEDGQLRKVTLYICKEGYVPSHQLTIEKSAIENAKDSIVNKPLLCAYEVDNDGNKTDFQGHEMKYKLIKNGNAYELKVEYIEQPVGVIPESCNVRFEEVDGEDWLVADGYLYAEYCGDAVRILDEADGEKAVSMEIKITETSEDSDKITHIEGFVFKGVTLLGESRNPAISGANISNFAQSEDFATKFEELIHRVNKLEGKGGEVLNREEILAKFEHLKGLEKFEELSSNEEITVEELEKELFSLSVNDLERKVREELKSNTFSHTDWWGDTYECQKYYLTDLLFEENIIICEDSECWYKFYGIPFTSNGDGVSIDFESAKRYIRGDWREYVEGETEVISNIFEVEIQHNKEKLKTEIESFESTKEELNKVKANFTDIQSEKVELEGKVEELAKFKADFEQNQKEEEIKVVLEKFSELSVLEGFSEIVKDKFEVSKEQLEMKLKAFAYDNGVIIGKNGSAEFSTEAPKVIRTATPKSSELSEIEARYGADILKYIK